PVESPIGQHRARLSSNIAGSSGGVRDAKPLREAAHKIASLIDAACPLELRGLRIRAERTRAIDLASGDVRRDQLVRRSSLFHPLLERPDFIEHIRTVAAATMPHPRR